VHQLKPLLPAPISPEQMDAYLTLRFQTYTKVPELIRACEKEGILFMVNTTGMIGYFQRILAQALLPPLPALSAHPMTRYAAGPHDPAEILPLLETTDKGVHTANLATKYNIPATNIIIMGDSGGDGPHFAWGAQVGAVLIASMAKPSLMKYCAKRHIAIDHFFGHTYADSEAISTHKELAYDFMDLWPVILDTIGDTDQRP
jgi:hypothetical protein